MKQIRLIREDFDVLVRSEGSTSRMFRDQYENGEDCPIARSLIRRGFTGVLVTPTLVIYTNKQGETQSQIIKGRFTDVRKASQAILDGKSYGVIKVTS